MKLASDIRKIIFAILGYPKDRSVPCLFEFKIAIISKFIKSFPSPTWREIQILSDFRSGQERILSVAEKPQYFSIVHGFLATNHHLACCAQGIYYHMVDRYGFGTGSAYSTISSVGTKYLGYDRDRYDSQKAESAPQKNGAARVHSSHDAIWESVAQP